MCACAPCVLAAVVEAVCVVIPPFMEPRNSSHNLQDPEVDLTYIQTFRSKMDKIVILLFGSNGAGGTGGGILGFMRDQMARVWQVTEQEMRFLLLWSCSNQFHGCTD